MSLKFDCIITRDPKAPWKYLNVLPEEERDLGGPFRECRTNMGPLLLANYKGSAHWNDHYRVDWHDVDGHKCGYFIPK